MTSTSILHPQGSGNLAPWPKATQLFFSSIRVIRALPGMALYYSPFRSFFFKRLMQNPNPLHRLDQSFRRFFLDYQYYRDVSTHRERLLAREFGEKWIEDYRSSPSRHSDSQSKFVAQVASLIQKHQLKRVVQLGCGGGFDLLSLLKELPGTSCNFLGVDLNAAAIAVNREKLSGHTQLSWLAANAMDTSAYLQEGVELVFTSGAAEYFTEKELKVLVRRFQEAKVGWVVFFEPVTYSSFDLSHAQTSTPRGFMAFNHAYAQVLEGAGYDVTYFEASGIARRLSHEACDLICVGQLRKKEALC